MRKIAITGDVASGKTVIANYLQSLGEVVVDSDATAHEILMSGVLNDELRDYFGEDIFVDGEIDRKLLLKKAFADEKNRHFLNQLIWTKVKISLDEEFSILQEQQVERVFVVIPRLFETDWICDYMDIWLVSSDKDLRIKRMRNRGYDEEEIELRLRVPFGLPKASVQMKILVNDDIIAALEQKVKGLLCQDKVL
ncbi:MAG: dephospho-CoA kinase [Pseudomonadales bacterium]|jgi:dephospho-CoA kinase|nr:dephospho-CoA kinase [Pseudomonadales bacterium]